MEMMTKYVLLANFGEFFVVVSSKMAQLDKVLFDLTNMVNYLCSGDLVGL